MAKDRFYRTKPHVNVATTRWLTQRGISPLGVHQITHGLMVTIPADRVLVAEMVAECSDGTGSPVRRGAIPYRPGLRFRK
jgi:hypothetical protein